eukprot:1144513-Pelagomonas_calceolata.AAC.2
MHKGMSAREYCDQLEKLLDDITSMSETDVLWAFQKGLAPRLEEFMLHDRPNTMHEAKRLVVRKAGEEVPSTSTAAKTGNTNAPMELDRIMATLSRLEFSNSRGRQSFTKPYCSRFQPKQPNMLDPRNDPKWPPWAKKPSDSQLARCQEENRCYLCTQKNHRWGDCPKLSRL